MLAYLRILQEMQEQDRAPSPQVRVPLPSQDNAFRNVRGESQEIFFIIVHVDIHGWSLTVSARTGRRLRCEAAAFRNHIQQFSLQRTAHFLCLRQKRLSMCETLWQQLLGLRVCFGRLNERLNKGCTMRSMAFPWLSLF